MVSLSVLSAAEQEASVPSRHLAPRLNRRRQLMQLLQQHNRWTGSKRARELLDDWDLARAKFVKVFPNEYKRAFAEIHARKAVTPAPFSSAGLVKGSRICSNVYCAHYAT